MVLDVVLEESLSRSFRYTVVNGAEAIRWRVALQAPLATLEKAPPPLPLPTPLVGDDESDADTFLAGLDLKVCVDGCCC